MERENLVQEEAGARPPLQTTTTTSSSTTTTTKPSQSSISRKAVVYMVLLAVQFGLQPALTRRFTPPSVCRSTVILVQECLKFCLAFTMLHINGSTKKALEGWTVYGWISIAGVPAALYAVQNLASLMAYQNLDALTYNVLNQTKTLSAALCCYLVMGKTQSYMQVVALLLLLVSALVMERIITLDILLFYRRHVDTSSSSQQQQQSLRNHLSLLMDSTHFSQGIVPLLLASFISGLAGALSQKNLEGAGGKDAYLFSIELCAVSIIILAVSVLFSADGELIRTNGFWNNWTPWTMIPILTNSIGGLIVGLVTKYAGSVRKGFALIFGIFISGILQAPDSGVSREQIVGGVLAGISLWMHSAYPAKKGARKTTKQD